MITDSSYVGMLNAGGQEVRHQNRQHAVIDIGLFMIIIIANTF